MCPADNSFLKPCCTKKPSNFGVSFEKTYDICTWIGFPSDIMCRYDTSTDQHASVQPDIEMRANLEPQILSFSFFLNFRLLIFSFFLFFIYQISQIVMVCIQFTLFKCIVEVGHSQYYFILFVVSVDNYTNEKEVSFSSKLKW